MNKGEYGNYIRIQADEDILNNTNTLIITSPSPVVSQLVITVAEGLTVGASTFIEDGISFTANQYVEYQIKTGEIFISGDWIGRLYSITPGGDACKINDAPIVFTIDP